MLRYWTLGLDTSTRTNQLEEKLAAILRFRIAHTRLATAALAMRRRRH